MTAANQARNGAEACILLVRELPGVQSTIFQFFPIPPGCLPETGSSKKGTYWPYWDMGIGCGAAIEEAIT